MKSIDINCDCGESYGNWHMGADTDIIPGITTANVACGFHAGDPVTMQRTIEIARSSNTVVGAHPGLPDLLGFGRRRIEISPEEAYSYVIYQAGALRAMLDSNDMPLHHVKPHGALYLMLNDNFVLARSVVRAIQELCQHPRLYWPASTEGLALPEVALDAGVDVVFEVYFDLDYDSNGRLVLQREKSALDLVSISERVKLFLRSSEVVTVDGGNLNINARSICIHGDGPNARELLEVIKMTLNEEGCSIRAASHQEAGTDTTA